MKSNKEAGDGIVSSNSNWSFGDDVPKSFSAHVSRSVPLYNEGHDLICRISDYFVHQGSVVYEIGVSTGSLLGKLAKRHEDKAQAKFIGLDVEQAMIDEAMNNIGEIENVVLECTDAVEYNYEKADLIVVYYSLQFISPRVRQQLVDKIFESLNWGGALLLFEKTRAPDARFQDICSGIYVDFKLDNGYTEEEIITKSRSLKGVLEPFSTQGNLDLMKRAGFVDMMTVMKFVPFEGFLAIK